MPEEKGGQVQNTGHPLQESRGVVTMRLSKQCGNYNILGFLLNVGRNMFNITKNYVMSC